LSCAYKYLMLLRIIIIIGLFSLLFFNGCLQSTALLGPSYTLISTGNVYQAGFSYGSSKVIKKMTDKTPTENIKSLLDNKKLKVEEVNYDEFFALVKNRIEKKSKIINLANQ
jgi:hypothetical protein